MTDAERIHELEDELAEADETIRELRRELRAVPDPYDWLHLSMVESDCRHCGRRFNTLPGEHYCCRDCANGWTRRESFEQYYARLHPARMITQRTMMVENTDTDPVLR